MAPRLRRRIALLAVFSLLGTPEVLPPMPAGAVAVQDPAGAGRGGRDALDPDHAQAAAFGRAPQAAGAPIRWLVSAATAPRRISYAGTKTVTVWALTVRASEVRIYHEAPDRTRLEYLAAGSQPARVVVISGPRQIEFVPGRDRYVEGPAPQTDEEALTRNILPRVAANYIVRFAGAERVAGRPARIIEIQGKLPGRPRIRLWIDTESRLILRMERYGPAGALRETSAFLTVQLDPVLSADLFTVTPPPGAQVFRRGAAGPGPKLTIEEISRRVGFIPQLPAYLPPGYQFIRSNVVMVRGTPTATFIFSDGVATMTLFESRGAQVGQAGGQSVRVGSAVGSVQARGGATVLHWNTRGISFTLVGDIASSELVRVGSSVPPAGNSGVPPIDGGLGLRGAVWRVSALFAPEVAEAANAPAPSYGTFRGHAPGVWPGVPPVPVSPYITNYTHPIGRGILPEEKRIWRGLAAARLTPFVVKVTVASDGVTRLPNGQLSRLAWIWFVYGMDRRHGHGVLAREAAASARALAVIAARSDPRVDRITLSGFYQLPGRFDGRRTDVTFTARLFVPRLLDQPRPRDPETALARAGDVWYSPDLLAGTVVPEQAVAHDPHLPRGVRRPVMPGDRTYESVAPFHGNLLQRIVDTKIRLEGLMFGVASDNRLWRGNPLRREVALTFDDGPSPLTTPLLLAVLRRYGAHATFFVIGQHVRAYPYLAARMAADGNEVDDHTYHHPNLTTVGRAVAAREIAAAGEVIERAAGRPARWFRPPGGDYTDPLVADARRAGLGLAMWTENTGDWALPPARILVDRVLARVQPGAIMLMHNGTLNTVQALPAIIVGLRRRGYTFVTISQLARDAE